MSPWWQIDANTTLSLDLTDTHACERAVSIETITHYDECVNRNVNCVEWYKLIQHV